MRESLIYNDKFQLFIRLLTAISFALFTAHQTYLTVQIETARYGRLVAVICYLLITIASFLMFADNRKAANARTILFVAGMLILVFYKLLNIPALFGKLSMSDPVSVLNCAVYVCAQLGSIGLVVYYITLRTNEDFGKMQTLRKVLSFIIVALFLALLIMDLVLITKYRANINLSVKLTVISRFLYFFSYAGTAICLMLPALLVEVQHKPGEFIYSEEDDDEIDLVI